MIEHIHTKHIKVIHILSESEPFSQYYGGALSRWAGNILSNSSQDFDSVVICPDADNSWQEIRYIKWNRFKNFKDLPKKLLHSKNLWNSSNI